MPASELPQTKQQIVDQEFLAVRAKLLEAAAALDRIDRARGDLTETGAAQRQLLDEAIAVLRDEQGARAEQLQLLFSRQYDPGWRTAFEI